MPRRSRARKRTEGEDKPTAFGEGKIEAEARAIKEEKKTDDNSVELRKRGNRPSADESPARPLTALEKSNGERKTKPKEPKIRVGLLTDINSALLKNQNKDKKPQQQVGGRIRILR